VPKGREQNKLLAAAGWRPAKRSAHTKEERRPPEEPMTEKA